VAVCAVPSPQAQPFQAPLSQDCQVPGASTFSEASFNNIATALQARNKIRILAIGASAVAGPGASRGGYQALLARILQNTLKGATVEIVNRGVSGELADAAADRLQIEVALEAPDLVLWQVGTADAMAQIPVDEFEKTVTETVRWLRDHKVDVVLVGLHYSRQLATDPAYQAMREGLRRIAKTENILRIGRYEAMEVIANIKDGGTPDRTEFDQTEAGYNCMAQYIARAITVGVFAKKEPRAAPAPAPEKQQ
jgi:lysophospholipase L1-like esterase